MPSEEEATAYQNLWQMRDLKDISPTEFQRRKAELDEVFKPPVDIPEKERIM